MRIAHIFPSGLDRVTGPRNSVTLLSEAMNQIPGVESRVYSVGIEESFIFNGATIYPLSQLELLSYDFYIFSGVYNPAYIDLAKRLVKARIPYAISPRGSLAQASMGRSRIKKYVFLKLYGKFFVHNASFIHYLCEQERISSILCADRSVTIPNIVSAIPPEAPCKRGKIIGYLGRLDMHHKGLDILLAALDQCKNKLSGAGWLVKLAGPDHRGGRGMISELIRKYGLRDLVQMSDALHGQDKHQFYEDAAVFIHTSRYEGLPQSVIESMAFGCAVYLTPGTNMADVVDRHKCGVMLGSSVATVADKLCQLADGVPEIQAMQKNARLYVMEYCTASVVAQRMIDAVCEYSGGGRGRY